MKCPYCAEEVQEEANVCRYCGRELSLILEKKRMQEKIALLEGQISKLSSSSDVLNKDTQSIRGKPPTAQAVTDDTDKEAASDLKRLQASLWLIILASMPFPALTAFLIQVFWLLSSQTGQIFAQVANVVGLFYLVVVPIVGGWAALIWHNRSPRWYILLGILVFATSFGFRAIVSFAPPLLGYPVNLHFNLGTAILMPFLFIFGALAVKFWQRKPLTERVSSELKQWQIILALFLPSGFLLVIESMLMGLAFLSIPVVANSPIISLVVKYVSVLMLLSPLLAGFWAGLAWPGTHPKGYILLGLIAALPASMIQLIIERISGDTGIPMLMVLGNTMAIWYVGGLTVVLFFAGGLFTDVLKNKTNSNLIKEPGYAQSLATGLAGPGEEPSKNNVLLIQALGPAIITFAGSILSVILTSLLH